MKSFCTSLREQAKNIIDFKKKIVIFHERRIKITSSCKSMLCLWKNNFQKVKKIVRKLDFIVTIQVNIEVHHILFVI